MDGYRYYKSSTHKQNRIYWYCRLRKSLDCKARVVMVDGVIVKGNLAHTHLPNHVVLGKWDQKRKNSLIKVKSMNELAKPMVSVPNAYSNSVQDQFNGSSSQQFESEEFDSEMQFKTEQIDDF